MWIKISILVLFVALLANLAAAYIFLQKDKGSTKRTWHSLSVRLVITVMLFILLFYGVYTGQLGSNAPWDQRRALPSAQQEP